ncbi:DNA cytosine methyltransferase [Nocardiopsis sp. CA-288880]|uniref:DNA cytosine methyltransferase n=1 Tax=Nocardiopsis sp. CA-288880 TaxID=3239995 RepID=UPI003D951FA7
MALTIGSLCSGYEGLGMSVQSVLDAELAWVADPDPGAAKILAHHYPHVPNLGDITAVDWKAILALGLAVDILTAGFPCQDVSVAGRKAGMRAGTRSGLWLYVLHIIRILRPRLVVIENVPGLRHEAADSDLEFCPGCMGDPDRQPPMRALGAVLAGLADAGFDAEWTTVAASDVGAPHRRDRVFLVAWPQEQPPAFTLRSRGPGRTVPGGVTLLPTPRVSDSAGPGVHGQGGLDLRTAISLLPTPRARDSKGRGYPDQLPNVVEGLALLPTPWASDGTHGGPNQRGSKGDLALPVAVQPERFAQYAAAIARWEPTMGRQVPAPTDPTGKGGRAQLSPRFVEWLMGLPAGHVTAPEIGLKRAEQLHALGNGVVPQQGSLALRLLLERVTAEVAA